MLACYFILGLIALGLQFVYATNQRREQHEPFGPHSTNDKHAVHMETKRDHHLIMSSLSFPQLYNCIPTKPLFESIGDAIKAGHHQSQSNEDIWLYRHIFSNLPLDAILGGFYIELGALDGLMFSNTMLFEKLYDWRGLLIEGHPGNAKKLRRNQARRANAVMYTNSICKSPGGSAHGHVTFTSNGGPIGATQQDAKDNFLKRWHKREVSNSFSTGINVTCVPMQYLLESTGVFDVELLSLDVEGAELKVLETINYNVTNIRIILVEIDGIDKQQDEKTRQFILSHGFINSTTAGLPVINGESGACNETAYGPIYMGCTSNEVFVNPLYEERRYERVVKLKKLNRYFIDGTGVSCPKNSTS